MKRIMYRILFMALAIPMLGNASENTLVFGDVYGWTIRTDLDREYRCFAEASYEDGSTVRAGFNSPDSSFYIAVSAPDWADIETDSTYEVSLSFDDEQEVTSSAVGTAMDTQGQLNGLRIRLHDDADAQVMRDFMDRSELSVARGGHARLVFSLAGSHAAVDELDDCHATMMAALERESRVDADLKHSETIID